MKRKIVLINLILTLFLIILYIIAPLGASSLIIWICLFVFYFIFFKSFSTPVFLYKSIPTFFKIDLLYYLFYYLLLYYPYQTYVLGSDTISVNSWVSNSFFEYSNKAIIASTIGLLGFDLGFSKIYRLNQKYYFREFSKQQYNFLFGFIVLVTFSFFILFFLKGGLVMLSGSYLGTRTKDASIDGLYTLLSVFISVIGGYTILYYKKFNSIAIWSYASILLFLAYGYLTLVGGDRNTFFIIIVALTGAYFSFIKSMSRKLLIVFSFLALGLYQVVEISRTSEERNLSAIIDVITGKEEGNTPSKVGSNVDEGSFSITNLVTRAGFYFVPERDDHTYGKFFIIGIAGIIPYARGVIIDPNDPDQASSFYITRVNGSGFGLGSSIIMDSYIEFGLIGVFFMPFVLGLIGKYILSKAQQSEISIKWGVIYLLALATYAEIPRYTFDFIFKNIGWALFIFVFFELFVSPKGFYKTRNINF